MKVLFALWLALVLALAAPLAGLAGAMSVDSGMPVFIPPLLIPPASSAGGVAGAGAAGGTAAIDDQQGVGSAAELAGAEAASENATRSIVQGLQDGARFCGSLPQQAYRVDCLSERLAAVAAAMPAQGDYAEAQAVLEQTAARLAALARANPAADLPRVTASRPATSQSSAIATTRPLTPVAQEALADVNAQATAILAEAETLLLRSSSLSDERRVAYQEIATAVGSGIVLLRSA